MHSIPVGIVGFMAVDDGKMRMILHELNFVQRPTGRVLAAGGFGRLAEPLRLTAFVPKKAKIYVDPTDGGSGNMTTL